MARQPNSGSFQKGHPKVGGRRLDPAVKTAQELCRAYTAECVLKLVEIARSDNERAAVVAATALLDRGWGRPAQTVHATVEHTQHRLPNAEDMRARLEAALAGRAPADPSVVSVQ